MQLLYFCTYKYWLMNNPKDIKFSCRYRLITRNKNEDALCSIVIECIYKGRQYRSSLGWKVQRKYWDKDRNNGVGEILEAYGKLTPKLDYILHVLRKQVVNEIGRELSTLEDSGKAPEKIMEILKRNTSAGAKIKINDTHHSFSIIFTSIDKIKSEQDKISKKLWDKLTKKSSDPYLEKMKKIDAVTGKVREVEYPDYLMKEIGKLECQQKPEMNYHFLIEYKKTAPHVGIYYGCKCIAPYNYLEKDLIDQADKDFKPLEQVIINALNAYFPNKNFKKRLKKTNNANYNTYWPFWITLNEDEDINKVGLKATEIIMAIYKDYMSGESDFNYKKVKPDRRHLATAINFKNPNLDKLFSEIHKKFLKLPEKLKKNKEYKNQNKGFTRLNELLQKKDDIKLFKDFINKATDNWIVKDTIFGEDFLVYRLTIDEEKECFPLIVKALFLCVTDILTKKSFEKIFSVTLPDDYDEARKFPLPIDIPWKTFAGYFVWSNRSGWTPDSLKATASNKNFYSKILDWSDDIIKFMGWDKLYNLRKFN